MDADHPYVLATAAEPGAPTLVELPGHWSLDDWEPYNYLPGITGSGVIASPADVLARWTLELEALVDEGGLFMLTNHPFVSRPGVARRRARAARSSGPSAIDGLWIATADEIAAHVATLGLEPVVHRPPSVPADRRSRQPPRPMPPGRPLRCVRPRLSASARTRPTARPNQ